MMDDRPTPQATRRPGVLGFPITLADGNEWGLAFPTVRLRPRVERGVDALGRPTEEIRVDSEYGFPIEIRNLVDDLRTACSADQAARRYEALIVLAIALLRRVHEIDQTTATSLLELDVENLPQLVDAVLSAIRGPCPEPMTENIHV